MIWRVAVCALLPQQMLPKIGCAVRDTAHRIDCEVISLLDEVVLQTRELCVRQDLREIDRAIAELCVEIAILAVHIFDVPHHEAARLTLEQLMRRPRGRMDHPEQVELQLHECRVGVSDENVISALAVMSDELEIVIVIHKLKPRFANLLADMIQSLREQVESIDAARFRIQPRPRDVFLIERVRAILLALSR